MLRKVSIVLSDQKNNNPFDLDIVRFICKVMYQCFVVRVTLLRRILFKVELKFFVTIPAFDILTSTVGDAGTSSKNYYYIFINKSLTAGVHKKTRRIGKAFSCQ